MKLRDALPPQVQDLARVVRDHATPSRRAMSTRIVDELAAKTSPDGVVLGGPFAGLRLPLEGWWGGLAARLSGQYEREIAPAILEMLSERPALVIDVGCAEGYYAVGIAQALPTSRVVAFELDPKGRRGCRETIQLNGAKNVRLRGRATPKLLQRVARPGAWVICDCEGYEQVLIDPASVPVLRECSLIVELHEFAAPGVTDMITERFAGSHTIMLIGAEPRTEATLPNLTAEEALLAVQEGRPAGMQWAVLRPR